VAVPSLVSLNNMVRGDNAFVDHAKTGAPFNIPVD
jgi:hypothetical protein